MPNIWTNWLTNNGRFPRECADYRRAVMLNFSLTLLIISFLIYGLYNVALHDDYVMASTQFGGVILGSALLVYFKLTHNVNIAAPLGVGLFIACLTAFLFIDQTIEYNLVWSLIVPAVSYFILGRRAGTIISGLFALFLISFMLWIIPAIGGTRPHVDTLINLSGTYILMVIIIRYFEVSRAAAHDELVATNLHLLRMSATDKLTSLYNRMKLDETLALEISRAETSLKPLSVIMLDLDDFKRINDEHGHIEGDSVLIQIAYMMRSIVPNTMTIGRWGGEEFMIVASHTDVVAATNVAERLRAAIEEFLFDGKIRTTISLGVAAWTPGDTVETLVRKSDHAMYASKNRGKNVVTSN